MTSPVPSLRAIAAKVAARVQGTTPPKIKLPEDLITCMYNRVNLQTVLDEVPRIYNDLLILNARMDRATRDHFEERGDEYQVLVDEFNDEAERLLERVEHVLRLFSTARDALACEVDEEWKLYYSPILDIDKAEAERLRGDIDAVRCFLRRTW